MPAWLLKVKINIYITQAVRSLTPQVESRYTQHSTVYRIMSIANVKKLKTEKMKAM